MGSLDLETENYIVKRENAEKGIYPCDFCTTKDPETCVDRCYPWQLWFRKHWRDIRAAAAQAKK